eukprot:TRINITY_DN2196_c0_g1_i2.p1 TRINITY_DN2196_c0_g1~~TRINITY_DN2196_c0_g1_i2.p1  ORF type:complete len:580 (-),score=203.84 TRINITY_DN2196_c0_g1_i2:641-2161(-)
MTNRNKRLLSRRMLSLLPNDILSEFIPWMFNQIPPAEQDALLMCINESIPFRLCDVCSWCDEKASKTWAKILERKGADVIEEKPAEMDASAEEHALETFPAVGVFHRLIADRAEFLLELMRSTMPLPWGTLLDAMTMLKYLSVACMHIELVLLPTLAQELMRVEWDAEQAKVAALLGIEPVQSGRVVKVVECASGALVPVGELKKGDWARPASPHAVPVPYSPTLMLIHNYSLDMQSMISLINNAYQLVQSTQRSLPLVDRRHANVKALFHVLSTVIALHGEFCKKLNRQLLPLVTDYMAHPMQMLMLRHMFDVSPHEFMESAIPWALRSAGSGSESVGLNERQALIAQYKAALSPRKYDLLCTYVRRCTPAAQWRQFVGEPSGGAPPEEEAGSDSDEELSSSSAHPSPTSSPRSHKSSSADDVSDQLAAAREKGDEKPKHTKKPSLAEGAVGKVRKDAKKKSKDARDNRDKKRGSERLEKGLSKTQKKRSSDAKKSIDVTEPATD